MYCPLVVVFFNSSFNFKGYVTADFSVWLACVSSMVLLGGRIARFQYPCQCFLTLAQMAKVKISTEIVGDSKTENKCLLTKIFV